MMKHIAPALAAMLLLLAASADAQRHPNLERGYGAAKAYDVGEIDTVNLFNGNLGITIPIGPVFPVGGNLGYRLALRYNSSLWDYYIEPIENCANPELDDVRTQATLAAGSNAGPGWALSLGDLLPSRTAGNPGDEWLYVSPDGGEHRFYPTLHEDALEQPEAGIAYSRDGSYLRLRLSDSQLCPGGDAYQVADVEFSDGSVHRFHPRLACDADFRLTSMFDVHDNQVTVSYSDYQWVLTDSVGRVQRVNLEDDVALGKVVSSVDLAAFGGARAIYSFHYSDPTEIARSCKHEIYPGCDPEDPNPLQTAPRTITVRFLVEIDQPDGSKWEMRNGTSPGYNLDQTADCDAVPASPKDRPATITRLTTPTGGTYTWTYGTWINPTGNTDCYDGSEELATFATATGVATRTLADPVTGTAGTWTYDHQNHLVDGAVDYDAQEAWTDVTDPAGNSTRSYFRTRVCLSTEPSQEGWDYGLPYTRGRTGSLPAPFKSVEQYAGIPGTGTLLRSTSFSYDHDQLPLTEYGGPPAPWMWYDSNRRTKLDRTEFHDDVVGGQPRYAVVDRTSFDGLGHYGTVTTNGNFEAGNARTTYTNYNSGGAPLSTEPWILGTSNYQTVSEAGVTARTNTSFSAATGFLECRSVLEGSGEDAHDLLAKYTPNAQGNVASEAYYGGDTQSLASGCAGNPGTPTYQIDHTYQYGALKTSQYAGLAAPFYLVDNDIDQSTGLVTTSRDATELATSFVYDAMGRLTRVTPQEGAKLQYAYTPASGSTGAKVELYACAHDTPNDCASLNPTDARMLARQSTTFDGFGRLRDEYARLPGNVWSMRRTAYDALGRKAWVSEWHPNGTGEGSMSKTTFAYDALGRPTTVTPPDGAAHAVSIAYTGVSQVTRTVQIATALGSESAASTTEVYDRQGRLVSVTEPSNAGSPFTTTYGYHVTGNLASVQMANQTRAFTYDNRGFLLSETLPEVGGANGYGAITYSGYDARGHVTSINDGEHTLTFTYDKAERLTDIRQGSDVLRQYTFGEANGTLPGGGTDRAKARLIRSWARTTMPAGANDAGAAAEVEETFTYGGLAGALSEKQTRVAVTGSQLNAPPEQTFTQAFTWNDLGQPLAETYPFSSELAGRAPERTVYSSYDNGYLTAVGPSYATAITYHPSGMIDAVTNATRGVTTAAGPQWTQELAGDAMPRPSFIKSNGVTSINTGLADDWLTGAYAYDGAGNIKTMGEDDFFYDQVSRLVSATIDSDTETYSYDPYGNLTSYDGLSRAVLTSPSGVTNRLSAAAYDAAGNLKSWGGYTLSYTPFNQQTSVQGGGLDRSSFYSADGERILLREGSTWTFTLRDLGAQVVREITWDGAWSWRKDYVYRGAVLLASVSPADGLRTYYVDHLGSPRLLTNRCGQRERELTANAFGLDTTGFPQAEERMRYTVHERDLGLTDRTVDDLDPMHARTYWGYLGRFTSVDLRMGKPQRPQTLNRYAYVVGRPLVGIDPDGLIIMISIPKGADLDKLLAELQEITGLTLEVRNGYLAVTGTQKGVGSAVARAVLRGRIETEVIYEVEARNNSRDVSLADRPPGTRKIWIDFRDFEGIDYGANDPLTYGVGMNFFHELLHADTELPDPSETDPGLKLGDVGPAVTFANIIRDQLGLQLRWTYVSFPQADGRAVLLFGAGRVYLPAGRRQGS